jgi:peroxiredoxin
MSTAAGGPRAGVGPHDPLTLPADLPRPLDDGAADHLHGTQLPHVVLVDTDGQHIDLAALAGRTLVYAYPRTGRPGQEPLVDDWDLIPGARGCTPQACDFRDHHAELTQLGTRVFGLSTQDSAYQAEAVERLHLPFALLSDEHLALTTALRLPTFTAAGQQLLRRLTLLVRDGVVEHVWYPVFPPHTHAAVVVAWLGAHPEDPPDRGRPRA